jgi:hypothetical protein
VFGVFVGLFMGVRRYNFFLVGHFGEIPWIPELACVFNWGVLRLITQIAARALKTMQEPSLSPPPPIAA